jgi:hypothetical protein
MGDIFDELTAPRGDIFDQIASETTGQAAHRRYVQEAHKPPIDTSLSGSMAETPLGGLVVGAAKGLGNTVYNLGNLVHKAVGSDALSGENDITRALEPTNDWQQYGKTAEQVGEFFVPGAAQAGKLAPIANAVGRAGLVGRMATEGASAAGVATAQGGDATTAGVAGAVAPAVAATIGKVAPAIMNTKIGAKIRQFRTGADPGAGIVDQGLVAGSTGGMFEKVKAAKDAVGAKIGQVLGATSKATQHRIDVSAFVNQQVDTAIRELRAAGKDAAAGAVENVRKGLQEEFAKRGSSMGATNAKELWEVRDMLDKAMRHGTDPLEASADGVRKAIRSERSSRQSRG